VAEGGGLLNRYRALTLYRGFESPSLRHNLCFSLRKPQSPPTVRVLFCSAFRYFALSAADDPARVELYLSMAEEQMRQIQQNFRTA
jgi:hypothetical protein